MMFHPSLSHPSPVQNAFPHIDWGDDPIVVSRPEVALLRSAEAHPLEYTIADPDDAYQYARVLLKVLDQATGPSDGNGVVSYFTLDTPVLDENDAIDAYEQDKSGVVTHYVINRLYELIALLLEDTNRSSNKTERISRASILSLFFQNDGQLLDDWRPLLRILYRTRRTDGISSSTSSSNSGSGGSRHRAMNDTGEDEYTKRGAALALAYILKAGCEARGSTSPFKASPVKQWGGQNNGDTSSTIMGGAIPPPTVHYQYGNLSAEAATPRSDRNRSMVKARMGPPSVPIIKGAAPKENNYNKNHHNNTNSRAAGPAPHMVEETLQSLISWLTSRLQSSHNMPLGVVTPTLMVLSTTPQARIAFDRAGGIGYLARHLKDPKRGGTGRRLKHHYQQSLRSGSNHHNSNSQQQQPYSTTPTDRQHQHQSLLHSRGTNNSSSNHTTYQTSPVSLHRPSATAIGNGSNQATDNGNYASSASSVASTAVVTVAASALALASETSRNILTLTSSPLPSPSRAKLSPRLTAMTTTTATLTSASVQELYELVFTLWCMTLDCPTNETIRQHFARDGAVPALAHLLKTASREKVLRLAVASLRNLATPVSSNSSIVGNTTTKVAISSTSDPATAMLVKEMIACGILKSLDTLSLRPWNDPDLVDDLSLLQTTILDYYKELTRWNVYMAEVETGVLRWGNLIHTESFFRENARQMEGTRGDFEPLQRLIYILLRKPAGSGILPRQGGGLSYHTSHGRVGAPPSMPLFLGYPNGSFDEEDVQDDELCETLAVCLYDVGEFVRHYPNGRVIAKQFGAKEVVMKYLKHPRPEIQRQALQCASKLLVNNWQAIGIAKDN